MSKISSNLVDFENIFHACTAGLLVINSEGLILSSNSTVIKRFKKLYPEKKDIEQLAGLNVFDFLIEKDRELIKNEIHQVISKIHPTNLVSSLSPSEKTFKLESIKGRTTESGIFYMDMHFALISGGEGDFLFLCTIYDPVKQKRNEVLLIEEREKYKSMFEKSPTFTMLIDLKGDLIECNNIFERKYGYHMGDIPLHFTEFVEENEITKIRKIFTDLYNKSLKLKSFWEIERLWIDSQYNEDCYNELLKIGVSEKITKFYNRNHSKIFDAEFNVSLFVERATLKEIGFIVTTIDITEKNLFRKRLEESEEKYREIFKYAPSFSMLIDTNGIAVEFNNKSIEDSGFDPEERTMYSDFVYDDDKEKATKLFMELYIEASNIKKLWYKDDVITKEECLNRLRRIKIANEPLRLINKKKDKIFEAEFSATLWISETDLTIKGALITSLDVSQRNLFRKKLEESEAKYRELFKFSPHLSMLIDPAGKAVEFNDISTEVFGNVNKGGGILYTDFVYKEDHGKAAQIFVDLYLKATAIRDRWRKEKYISRDTCMHELRLVRVDNEALRLIDKTGEKIYETEVNASLWIREKDLAIMGALITSIDVSERNLFRKKVDDSERKYRELVEEKTRDIIFTLDKDGQFITVNKNIYEKLGYTEEFVKGKSITMIVHDDPMDKNRINRETFVENIKKIVENNFSEVRFKTVCKHKYIGESITLQFKLEPVYENNQVTGIMGFASSVSDDPIRDFLQEERLMYRLENKITYADEISYRITRNLERYFNIDTISLYRIGLREIILNAIEHGNLGISFEEKTESMMKDSYHDLINSRINIPENADKIVYINYHLTEEKVVYIIRDDGDGFDYNAVINQSVDNVNMQMLQHGRGIFMAMSIFDEVLFNEKGNEVHLIGYKKNEE